ncbi:MAG TPA: hypothetical protein VN132_06340 [Bdellovibrio sp.]|nr:hypothetical protein [Bdellovibrio sp.]
MTSLNFTPASPPTLIAFMAIIVAVVVMFLSANYFASRKLLENAKKKTAIVGLVLFSWLFALAIIVQNGLLQEHPFPTMPLFFIFNVGAVLWFSFSHWGAKLALAIPICFLIAFQIFRLPLELILHSWSEQGTIPSTMTWTGQNFDIITGILALALAPLAGRIRWAAWTFNVIGLALLLNVMRVAVMSSPLPFAWSVEPPLQLIFHLPYALIAPVCVGGALAGHIILTRALLYH